MSLRDLHYSGSPWHASEAVSNLRPLEVHPQGIFFWFGFKPYQYCVNLQRILHGSSFRQSRLFIIRDYQNPRED